MTTQRPPAVLQYVQTLIEAWEQDRQPTRPWTTVSGPTKRRLLG